MAEAVQGPHVSLQTIVQSFRIWILWSFAVVNRDYWYVERVRPFSCVCLMDKRTHTDEAATVDVKDDCFRWRVLFLKDLFYALQIVFQIFAENVKLFLEKVRLFVLEFLEFSQIELKRVVNSD